MSKTDNSQAANRDGVRRSTGKAASSADRQGSWPAILPYALLSAGSFAAALVLLGLLIWKVELLARLGLTGNFYYVALIPLGLAVAAFLFGSLRSFARFRGRHSTGALDLGGPVVGFALVIVGGFLLPPAPNNFAVTVYVQDEGDPRSMPLKNEGHVLLDLGADRRKEPIGDRGNAYFPEIPASFRGQPVQVLLDAPGFESAGALQQRLDGSALYLPVRRRAVHLSGNVVDDGGHPVAKAAITIAGLSTTTGVDGRFTIVIPADRARRNLVLRVGAAGYSPWEASVVAGSNDVTAILSRVR